MPERPVKALISFINSKLYSSPFLPMGLRSQDTFFEELPLLAGISDFEMLGNGERGRLLAHIVIDEPG